MTLKPEELRQLAKRIEKGSIRMDETQAILEILVPTLYEAAYLREENARLADCLADEILTNSREIPEIARHLEVGEDIPEGFQPFDPEEDKPNV